MSKRQSVRRWMACLLAAVFLRGCGGASQDSVKEQPGDVQKAESTMTAMIISIPQGDPFLTLAYAGVEQLGKASYRSVQCFQAEELKQKFCFRKN